MEKKNQKFNAEKNYRYTLDLLLGMIGTDPPKIGLPTPPIPKPGAPIFIPPIEPPAAAAVAAADPPKPLAAEADAAAEPPPSPKLGM